MIMDLDFQQEVIRAINPTSQQYETAGRIAGARAAERLGDYLAASRKTPSIDAILMYQAAAMDAACARMRATGATDGNLQIWRDGYARSLRGRLTKSNQSLPLASTR